MKRILLALILVMVGLVGCQTNVDNPTTPDPNPDPPNQLEPINFRALEVATGQNRVWSMKFAPDGQLFYTVRDVATVQVRALNLQTRAIQTFTATSSSVRTEGEGGVLGLELDPQFASNKRLYVCYSYTNSADAVNGDRNRVSAFTISGNNLTNEQILLDEMLGWWNHNGCRLVFGPDGKLFITMGEAGEGPSNVNGEAGGAAKAQSLNLLSGKIFRINSDGSIPNDNPFFSSTSGSLRAIWTFGHRNPQGLAFQPGTGLLWSAEHGQDTRDELNVIKRGKNYGWPACAGTQRFNTTISPPFDIEYNCRPRNEFSNLTAANYQPAVREYAGGTNGNAPTIAPSNLTFYQGTAFPTLQGHLLMATLKTNRLYRLQIEGEQVVGEQIMIDANRGFGRLRDVQIGPDGFIYISSDDGKIRRLEPN
jgi:aldose sugar dehydrogenase